MQRFSTKVPSKIRDFSLSRPGRFTGRHALGFLNVSQLLSALNDNLFKFLTIYLLLDLKGSGSSNEVLFWIGVFYVLPFLLFSSLAGVLTDYFSKQKLIIFTKILEVVFVLLGFIAFSAKSVAGCFAVEFLLSLQSALLSPPKYSIIPELVKENKISKANGIITASTYLAVIVGTFLASFLTQLTQRNFTLCLLFCLLFAVIGLVTSLYIPATPARKNRQKVSPLFLSHIFQTLKICKKTPKLFLCVLLTSFFLFIGAFVQLNIIPYAINALHLTEVAGGYLFLFVAVGIAIGSTLSGRLCRKGPDLGLTSFSALALSLVFLLLPLLSFSLGATAFILLITGVLGGLFVVPVDSYIQGMSDTASRGSIVATASFLSFFCVLLAPIALILFGSFLSLSAKACFFVLSLLVFLTFIFSLRSLSSYLCHFVVRRFIAPFFDLRFLSPLSIEPAHAFVVRSPLSFLLLFGETPHFTPLIVKDKPALWHPLLARFSHLRFLYLEKENDPKKLLLKAGKIPLFFFSSQADLSYFHQSPLFRKLSAVYQFQGITVKQTGKAAPSWKTFYKRHCITYQMIELSSSERPFSQSMSKMLAFFQDEKMRSWAR